MHMNGKLDLNLPSPIQPLNDQLFENFDIKVFAKRDDLIDKEISGNKWRKLKYNILNSNGLPILTFGGAFSNHIAATAATCFRLGVRSIGIIRGERTLILNNTLQQAEDCGMQLHFISRSDYRLKNDKEFIIKLHKLFGEFFLIPEGGANLYGVKGAGDIVDEIELPYDYLISAMGTGTTLSGMLINSNINQLQVGIPVLKNGTFLNNDVSTMISTYCSEFSLPQPKGNSVIFTDYHFGGYARITNELIDFIRYFFKQHHIKTDPVYSGKSAFALYDLIKRNYFKKGSTVVWLHCGGLQGIEGIENRYGINLF